MRELAEIVKPLFIVSYIQQHNIPEVDEGIVSITNIEGIKKILLYFINDIDNEKVTEKYNNISGKKIECLGFILSSNELIDMAYNSNDNELFELLLADCNLKYEPLLDYLNNK